MPEHDPLRFAAGLSAKLATKSRHVCALLGAGVGRACGLPDVIQLQQRVLDDLGDEHKAAFEKQLEDRNLEEALSRLRRISALITGEETVDELTANQADALDVAVCQVIVRALDVQVADRMPVRYLAAWAGRADYHLPVELFTVNYDLLLETALEDLQVPYFDGFVGAIRARFQTDLVESPPGSERDSVPAFFVRLWKLHGSLNWVWQDDRQIVRLGQPVSEGRVAAIYPSDTKYEESRRVPFVVLQDRLRRALHQAETLALIAGYSFGDFHLNELVFDAAARRARSEFVVFCYSNIPDSLAERAITTPNLQVVTGREAILGGIRANWKPPEEALPGVWEDDQLTFRDFGKLAVYLSRSVVRETEFDTILKEQHQGNVAVADAAENVEDHG